VNAPGVIGDEEDDLEDLEEQDEEGLGVRLKKHMEMLY
jgi:hypothetical protein